MKLPTAPEAIGYKNLRLSIGMSATQMAEELGVTRETISRREAGTMRITREAQLALAHVCETLHPILNSWRNSELMGYRNDETPKPNTKKRHR